MKKLGQYFTPKHVADFMVGLTQTSKSGIVLEPSCGEGVFLESLKESGFTKVTGYEVDKTLKSKTSLKIIRESFLKNNDVGPVDMIIGNPPYIRWKNLDKILQEELRNLPLWNEYFTSLSDYLCIFILKSISLLRPGGELIFITPEYWLNTKGAESLRGYMSENGYFTDIIHFSETPIFSRVSSSIIIFRYVKYKRDQKTADNIKVIKYTSNKTLTFDDLEDIKTRKKRDYIHYFSVKPFTKNRIWTIADVETLAKLDTYEQQCSTIEDNILPGLYSKHVTIGDIADIANGMVSGLDKAFQVPPKMQLSKIESKACLDVLKAKNISKYTHGETQRYMFLGEGEVTHAELLKKYPNFEKILSPHITTLNKRYRYGRDIKYWEWVFPRSLKLFQSPKNKIFVPCKERISHKEYFRFTLVEKGVFPTQDVTAIVLKDNTRESIYYVTAILNSSYVFEWLKYRGVVKGNIVEFSEKPISSIPFRKINWSNPTEVILHDKITKLCKDKIIRKDTTPSNEIDMAIKKLLSEA